MKNYMNRTGGPNRDARAPQSLRLKLRESTAALHDRLDTALRPPENWRPDAEYVRFLTAQYEARVAVEHWLAENAAADLLPPEQTPLLARDLDAMGAQIPSRHFDFALKDKAPSTTIGVAWVLAGSSLGNRAMLNDMRRALPEKEQLPAAFLSDTAMTEFWQGLRPRIEKPASPQDEDFAVRAAGQVFDHFLNVAEITRPQSSVELAQ